VKVKLIQTGRSHFDFVEEGYAVFEKRIRNYMPFENILVEIPGREKNASPARIKEIEAGLQLKKIKATDFVILLDEKGMEKSSTAFAAYLEKLFMDRADVVFVIGGAYGFADELYARANAKLSLSKMTFSHQLIRVIFAEQLYRALTIIRGEPYHHA
jgi:23S rRNA (pseudouridine1915-N3)-methyltransferase